MRKLIDGIHSFRKTGFHQDQELFERLAKGQSPPALFITCADSRIDPNRLMQAKPGEIFIQRTAGNIVPPYGAVQGGEAATIEYAVQVLNVKDIVVCGHSHCGAMSGLLNPESLTTLPAVRSYLQHAEATRRILDQNHADLQDPEKRLTLAIEENVLVQLENLRTHPAVAAALGRSDISLHGWVYRFETGDVFAFDRSKRQFLPIEGDATPATPPDRTSPPS